MSESRTKQQTRRQIQNAFLGLLSEKGLDKISVTSISKAAGINRCTFYEYYPNIHSLMEDVENELLSELNTRLQSVCIGFTAERMDEVFIVALQLMQKHGDTLIILLGSKGDPNFSQKFIDLVKPLLLSAFHLKKLTPQMNTAVTFAMSGLIGIFTSWYASDKQEPMENVIHTSQKLLKAVLREAFNDNDS